MAIIKYFWKYSQIKTLVILIFEQKVTNRYLDQDLLNWKLRTYTFTILST
jgi:hypothetical protein